MSRRIQLEVPEEEFDRLASNVFDGLRSRVIRNLLTRACDAIEGSDSNVTLDDLVRGDFILEDYKHGNF